jgi:hypothetical protein
MMMRWFDANETGPADTGMILASQVVVNAGGSPKSLLRQGSF